MEEMVESKISLPDSSFWKNKNVLLTGHSGFKGTWMSIILNSFEANVCGISLRPNTEPNLFNLCKIESKLENNFCDIRNYEEISKITDKFRPEIVIHMAALPLVRESYSMPVETFETNVLGTVNILDSLKHIEEVRSIICITTDKVYKNKERIEPYKENDELGGHDPYSSSKAASEIAISCYRDSFLLKNDVGIASVRAGNVIGGGDWSLDRLIPDAIRAWTTNSQLKIRYPNSVRPWQHVLEPIFGYLVLAENMYHDISFSGSYNFGPDSNDNVSVKSVIKIAQDYFENAEVEYSNDKDLLHEAGLLTLDNTKVKDKFGIMPVWDFKTATKRTIEWYKLFYEGHDPITLCNQDIENFTKSVSSQSR
ncbi:MAG: CDP-glucose 4,6-dehydratase [Gammaproteobacteria bacterium]